MTDLDAIERRLRRLEANPSYVDDWLEWPRAESWMPKSRSESVRNDRRTSTANKGRPYGEPMLSAHGRGGLLASGERRAKYAEANPQKVRARLLIGNAVRRGYMEAPSDERNWHNQWEFHHPDHARPYYGVWMRMNDYKAMHRGALECPPCIDYTSRVWARLHDEWGLP